VYYLQVAGHRALKLALGGNTTNACSATHISDLPCDKSTIFTHKKRNGCSHIFRLSHATDGYVI
jgi:hypothetical protein